MDTTQKEQVFPHFKIFVIDETHNWSEEMQAKAGGGIYRAYLFDANRHVYCCEMTPSYELYPLYTTALVDDDEGTVESELRYHENNDVLYLHVRSLDSRPEGDFHAFPQETVMPESWDALREDFEEYSNGNIMIQFPDGVNGSIREATPA